ncbi:MAG: hypothetical protein ACP5OO_07215 [Chloroflexia bacterium]
MDIRKALTFVQEQGDGLARARAEALLEASLPPAGVVADLEKLQGPEGGWPADLRPGLPESVVGTWAGLRACQDLGLLGRPMARRGKEFLLARQGPDGGWEDPGLEGGPRPRWMSRGEEAGRLYVTALVSSLFVACGWGKEPALGRALDLLLKHQQEGGVFPGFPRQTTWYALPLLAAGLGRQSGPAQNILLTLGRAIGEGGWSPGAFASLLLNLLISGYGMETLLVRQAWEQILMRQREDGAWEGEEGEDAVQSTLEVMRCWRRIILKR